MNPPLPLIPHLNVWCGIFCIFMAPKPPLNSGSTSDQRDPQQISKKVSEIEET
jgi:hypothetical protein